MKVIFKNCDIAIQNYPMDVDTEKILNSYTRNFTFGQTKAINRYVVGMKKNGLWDKIDYMILPCLAEEVGEAFINIKNIEDVNAIDTSGYGLRGNTIVTLEGGKQVTLNLPSDVVYNDMHMAAQIVIHENLTRDVRLTSNFPRLGISNSNAVMAQARKSNESVTAIPHQSNLRKTFDEKSLIMLTTGGNTTLSLYQNSDTTPVNNSSVTIMDATFNKVQFGDFASWGVIGCQMFSIGKAMTADDYMNLNILTKSLVGYF